MNRTELHRKDISGQLVPMGIPLTANAECYVSDNIYDLARSDRYNAVKYLFEISAQLVQNKINK